MHGTAAPSATCCVERRAHACWLASQRTGWIRGDLSSPVVRVSRLARASHGVDVVRGLAVASPVRALLTSPRSFSKPRSSTRPFLPSTAPPWPPKATS
eukprot:scaffold616_cov306-Pavlova_lutheri.AAC.11